MKIADKYEIDVHPFFIAQVRNDVEDEYLKQLVGKDIYFLTSINRGQAILISPIKSKDIEEYWLNAFNELKGFISDNLQDFLNVMLAGEECCTSTVELSDLYNFRFLTQEDHDEYMQGNEELIQKYHLDRVRILGDPKQNRINRLNDIKVVDYSANDYYILIDYTEENVSILREVGATDKDLEEMQSDLEGDGTLDIVNFAFNKLGATNWNNKRGFEIKESDNDK